MFTSKEAFRRPCRKKLYIWHKLFIQTVKCSSFNQRIVYQSFYGALLMLSHFFLQVLCFLAMHWQVACEMFIVWSIPKTLWKKLYVHLYLTQTVHSNGKMLFFQPKDCLSKFLWHAAHVKLFFLQVLCFIAMRVAFEMFIVWSVPTLSRKWYLRYLTQTVHLNSKILFPLTKEKIVNFVIWGHNTSSFN